MRVAVLNDIHGNLPALRAVLAEVDAFEADALVVGGDVVAGPLVRECLELLDGRSEPMHWISGNSEREAVEVFNGQPPSDDPAGEAAAWTARALDARWRDELASWPIVLTLDGVVYCHGSPRSDDEIITVHTPDDALAGILADVDARLVVGGHTHRQVVRALPDGKTYANAGSIGLPYEGRAAAFWMTVADGAPELRETTYDLDAALAELRAAGFTGYEAQLEHSLITPMDADAVSRMLEERAKRE